MNTLSIVIWLGVGFLLGGLLILYSRTQSPQRAHRLMGLSLVIAALIYVGFALIWGNGQWVIIELAGVPLYGLFAWWSLRTSSPMWVGIGWLLHPVWDSVLHLLGPGSFLAPAWYAVACISFDLLVGGYIFIKAKAWKMMPQ